MISVMSHYTIHLEPCCIINYASLAKSWQKPKCLVVDKWKDKSYVVAEQGLLACVNKFQKYN